MWYVTVPDRFGIASDDAFSVDWDGGPIFRITYRSPYNHRDMSQCIQPCFYLSIHSGAEAEVVFRVCLDFTTCSEYEEKKQFPSRTLGINYTF